jgi:hypothetical protein
MVILYHWHHALANHMLHVSVYMAAAKRRRRRRRRRMMRRRWGGGGGGGGEGKEGNGGGEAAVAAEEAVERKEAWRFKSRGWSGLAVPECQEPAGTG